MISLSGSGEGPRVKAGVTDSHQFEAALAVVEKLRAAGFEAYLAGGCVRDLLMERDSSDYDVATSATPDVASFSGSISKPLMVKSLRFTSSSALVVYRTASGCRPSE